MTDIYPSMDMHSTEFFLYEHFAHKHYAEVTADVESVQACAAYQQRFQVPILCIVACWCGLPRERTIGDRKDLWLTCLCGAMLCCQTLAGGMILMTFVRFMDCVRYEGKMVHAH